MHDYTFRAKGHLKSKTPVFICGLPDSGLVAKIALDHMIELLRATSIGNVYSPHLPPQVIVRENGVAELVGHQLYQVPKANLVLYTGDSQPVDGEGAYKLSEFIVKLVKRYRAKEIIILAALIKDTAPEEPQVVASAASAKQLEEYLSLGVKPTGTSSITWMHGLVLGEALKEGVRAMCLSGETKGDLPDPRAAGALLKVLEKRLKMDLGTSKLDAAHDGGRSMSDETGRGPEEPEKGEPTYIG